MCKLNYNVVMIGTIMADIVPEKLYSKIYAFDRSFEGAVAATAAPIVGIIAENIFGFKGVASDKSSGENAIALANSLLGCCIVPWVMSCAFYSGLYWTFPKDKNFSKLQEKT